MPAWTARALQQNHAYILSENPQAHTEIPFSNFVSTRIAEKDNFNRNLASTKICNQQTYTLPSTIQNKDATSSIKKHLK